MYFLDLICGCSLANHKASLQTTCNLWISKTHWAQTIVHEIRPGNYMCDSGPNANLSLNMIPGDGGKFKPTPGPFNVTNVMMDFGYMDEDCDVYRCASQPLCVARSCLRKRACAGTGKGRFQSLSRDRLPA